MIRGKLLLPDFEVRWTEEKDLQELKSKLVESLSILANYSCERAKDDEIKATNIFADLISIIYKLPMLMSYTPHTGLSTPFEYFFTYVIARHLNDIKYGNIKELLESLESHRDEYKRLFVFATTLRDIYEKLLYTPADTRPGYNFTSLVSHLQLTSILVWLLQPYSLDLNHLRIAALLHDLGKLFNPANHVTESVDILNQVNAGCLKPTLSRVKDLVEQHHGDFLGIIEMADRLAASTDRLRDLVVNALDVAGIDRCKDVCYSPSSKTKECNECLEKLGKESYENASKILYKSILESLHEDTSGLNDIIKGWSSTPSKKTEVDNKEKSGKSLGYLIFIDFPGVQRFITSFPKLRDMSFASFLVDFLTSVYSFIVLDQEYYKKSGGKSRIPAEALLTGYGGHSYIVVRGDYMDEKEIKNTLLNSSPEELDVKFDVRVVDFAYQSSGGAYVMNYKEIRDEIADMGYERYLVNYEEKVHSLGLHRVCDSCGIRPAVTSYRIDNEVEYLCQVCGLIRELSESRGFMAKLNSTYFVNNQEIKPLDHIDIKFKGVEKSNRDEYIRKISKYAMEAIAGYKNEDDTKYVAFVKADGNDGGKIFGYTATFSEYIDKSFRLDYGVKKKFYDTISELLNAEREVIKGRSDLTLSLTSRVLVGVLYLGGDDIMLLMPSIIAVPFAVRMFDGIKKESGFTFKVGVISVKPDHPVQFAYKAVNELMESSKLSGTSSLGCLVFSSTLATDGVVESDLKKYRHEQDSYLVVANDIERIKTFLEIVGLEDGGLFKRLLQIYLNDDRDKVRDMIRPLEDLSNYANTHNFYDTLAYILRYRARAKGGGKKDEYELVSFLLSNCLEKLRIPLYDYYFILKSIRVGV